MKKLMIQKAGWLCAVLLALSLTTSVQAENYILHVSGLCSTQWVKEGTPLANAPDMISIDAKIDTRTSVAFSALQLKERFDEYCTDDNWCYVLNYSAGEANTSYVLANYEGPWNIAWVGSAGAAGGGSEFALGWLAEIFTCDYAGDLWVSTIRNMYNHNDTGGVLNFHVGGNEGYWYASPIIPGVDDGVVGMHSSAACNEPDAFNDLCSCTQFDGHRTAFDCQGYPDEHQGIKTRFIYEMGW